jgi:4-oxalocrotonate tautomerase
MPLVTARICAEPGRELTAEVVRALTDPTVGILGKERKRTTVVVDYTPAERWARGGILPARGFYVEVKVTQHSNSRDEKARYVHLVNQALHDLLHGTSGYVIINEIGADAWGYGGVTQEARYAAKATALPSSKPPVATSQD